LKNDTKSAGSKPAASESGGSFWVLLIVLGVGAVILIRLQSGQQDPLNAYAGQPLPPLHVAGWLNTNRPLTTADLQGNVVLVDYWATWCGPCVRGIPDVIQFNKKFRSAGVLVVGLTSEDGPSAQLVKNFVETRDGMDWPIAYGAGQTFHMMGINSIPQYMLYDRSGTCVWGGHSLDGIEQAAVAALAEKN
jgi:thiol-disulfide isomerase/thioredoxin